LDKVAERHPHDHIVMVLAMQNMPAVIESIAA
jgi:hypothetical protein